MRIRLPLVFLLASALIGCVGTATGTGRVPGPADTVVQTTGRPFCIGRYDVMLPAAAGLRGREQSMVHMTIQRGAAAHPGAVETRVAGDTALLTREITADGWHEVETVARRWIGGETFEISGRHDTATGIAAQRQAALALAAALQADAPRPGGRGFCIDGAVINRAFEWQEAASAGFSLAGGSLVVRVASNGRSAPGRLADPSLLGRLVTGMETLRSGTRSAAGHRGDEMVVRAGRSLLLVWSYPGEPLSGAEPSIEIRWEVEGDAAVILAQWDAMLDSLARRPG